MLFDHKSTVIYADTNVIIEDFVFSLIDGYDKAFIETFSVSPSFLRAFTGAGGFSQLDIVYGVAKMVLADSVQAAAKMLPLQPDTKILALLDRLKRDDTVIYEALLENKLRMFLSPQPSHKKLFLLSKASGERRAIIGSANASVNSVCGVAEEAVTVWDEGPVCDGLFARAKTRLNECRKLELAESLSWLDQASRKEAT